MEDQVRRSPGQRSSSRERGLTASTATRELDELMANLSKFEPASGKSGDYSHTGPEGQKPKSAMDNLNSMLGSLDEDMTKRHGVNTAPKGGRGEGRGGGGRGRGSCITMYRRTRLLSTCAYRWSQQKRMHLITSVCLIRGSPYILVSFHYTQQMRQYECERQGEIIVHGNTRSRVQLGNRRTWPP